MGQVSRSLWMVLGGPFLRALVPDNCTRPHKMSDTPKEQGAQENGEEGICSHTYGTDEGHQIHKGFPRLEGTFQGRGNDWQECSKLRNVPLLLTSKERPRSSRCA